MKSFISWTSPATATPRCPRACPAPGASWCAATSRARTTLRLIFLLLDVRRTPGEHDLQMHHWSRALDSVDEKIVLTKSDKLSNNQLATSRRAIAQELELDDAQLIAASAVNKKGIDQIRREMIARL